MFKLVCQIDRKNHINHLLFTDFKLFLGIKTTSKVKDASNNDHDPFGMLLVGRNWEGGSEYRFGFNTQEQDNEVCGNGNLNSAEFWVYDTRLGRRWNLDPKPDIAISSYACFQNNPIWLFDIKGDTTYRFNKTDGKFLEVKDVDKPGLFGSLGTYKSAGNESYWEPSGALTFNDPKVDKVQLEFMRPGDKVIQIISDEEINGIMVKSDIYWRNPVSRVLFAKRESGNPRMGSGNKMDFPVVYLGGNPSVKGNDYIGGFFIFGDITGFSVAYNAMDGGQFLWGNAMQRLGFSRNVTRFASDANESFKDSTADRIAIGQGYDYKRY